MSAHRSVFSARSHHTTHSHRTRPRDDDLDSNAPPASIASFAAPTVVPMDSVSQIGGRHSHSHLSARHSSHSSRRSHSPSNAPWDDASSGLLTQRNLQAHNAESQSRSTSRPPPQVYVEVYEERTATSGYDSYADTPRQSSHSQERYARSHHTSTSHSHHGGTSRIEREQRNESKTQASLHPSHTPQSHVSSSSHHSHAQSSASRSSSRTPTQVSKRDHSSSPTRSSASRTTILAYSISNSKPPTSAPSNLPSHESKRVSQYEISPARSHVSSSGDVYEISVEYDERDGHIETGQVEVEEADDQVRTSNYRIHHRHQYPVYIES